MSSKDFNDVDHAEFEAFLQGKGELASLLQACPQPVPQAELDAAILADAGAALARGMAAGSVAANDPVLPPVNPARSRFISRWKLPLALAASLLVTVQLMRMWSLTPALDEPPVLVAAAPAPAPAPARSGAVSESAPAIPQDALSARSADSKQLAQIGPEASLDGRQQSGQRRGAAEPIRPDKSEAPAVSYRSVAPTVLAEADIAGPKSVLGRNAAAPVVAPAGTPAAPSPHAPMVSVQPDDAAKPAVTIDSSQQPSDRLKLAEAPRQRQEEASPAAQDKTDALKSKGVWNAAPQAESRSAAGVAAIASASGIAESELATGRIQAAPALPPAQAAAARPVREASDWLAQIDQLIKAGKRKEALDEWAKFHQTYPEYPVPKRLAGQIGALKK